MYFFFNLGVFVVVVFGKLQAVLGVYSWLCASWSLLVELDRQCIVLKIEPRPAMCKTSSLSTVLSLPLFFSESTEYKQKGKTFSSYMFVINTNCFFKLAIETLLWGCISIITFSGSAGGWVIFFSHSLHNRQKKGD